MGLGACVLACRKQYLVGYYSSKESFLKDCQWKNKEGIRYKPLSNYVDSLKTLRDTLEVKLFLGTWCSDSKKWVPRFFHLMQYLPIKSLEIIAVDTSKLDSKKLALVYQVDSVPTFLFFKNQNLYKRLNVKPHKMRLEKALYHLLKPS